MRKIILAAIGSIILTFTSSASLAYASAIQDSAQQVADKLNNILDFAYTLFFVLVAIVTIYDAFLFLNAAGDPQKITKAKKYLVYIIISVILALTAGGSAALIAEFFQ